MDRVVQLLLVSHTRHDESVQRVDKCCAQGHSVGLGNDALRNLIALRVAPSLSDVIQREYRNDVTRPRNLEGCTFLELNGDIPCHL